MSGGHIFNVCAPQLLNLTITGLTFFLMVFNVVAPQLENLTALVMSPNDFLQLSTEGLEKVNLSEWSIDNDKIFILQLLDLFRKLRSAKFLILDPWIIKVKENLR